MIKVLEKLGIKGTFFNINKVVYNKPTANIILNREQSTAFSLKSESR